MKFIQKKGDNGFWRLVSSVEERIAEPVELGWVLGAAPDYIFAQYDKYLSEGEPICVNCAGGYHQLGKAEIAQTVEAESWEDLDLKIAAGEVQLIK